VFAVIAVSNEAFVTDAIFCDLYLDRATKLIAKIRQIKIIVRDANRIHHFYANGQCSCQDHF
jgi:hypothetical protein